MLCHCVLLIFCFYVKYINLIELGILIDNYNQTKQKYTFVIKLSMNYNVIELIKKSNLKYICCYIIPLSKTCYRESELQRFAMQSFST